MVAAKGIRAVAVWQLLALLLCMPITAQSSGAGLVAAASDLQFALSDIAELFESRTGSSIKLSFGSSGNIARQIRQGAPFEIYFSADEKYALDLARDGYTRDAGQLYAIGRVVVIAPHHSDLEVDDKLSGLQKLLDRGQLTRFAIANPEHAPYGQRAEQSLKFFGLWDQIEAQLLYGENVSQAAQFATSGNAQGGLIAYSLALSKPVSARGNYALIPEQAHSPLRQRMVLLKNAGAVAERFYNFVQLPEVREIFRSYGFSSPLAGS